MHGEDLVHVIYAPSADLPVNTNWRLESACRETDSEMFFPTGTTGRARFEIQAAKNVCSRCTVTGQCLQWALDSGEPHGVWGGLDVDERRRMNRAAARTRSHRAA